MAKISACSSCGRSIIWTTSPEGARLPVDARPVTVYELRNEVEGRAPDAVKHDEGERALHISHFLTCPTVGKHTKGGR